MRTRKSNGWFWYFFLIHKSGGTPPGQELRITQAGVQRITQGLVPRVTQ